MKLYSLSNFDRLYLRQYRSYEQTSKHRCTSFWPEKGFGTSLGCHRYFSMTQLPLQVKRTVYSFTFDLWNILIVAKNAVLQWTVTWNCGGSNEHFVEYCCISISTTTASSQLSSTHALTSQVAGKSIVAFPSVPPRQAANYPVLLPWPAKLQVSFELGKSSSYLIKPLIELLVKLRNASYVNDERAMSISSWYIISASSWEKWPCSTTLLIDCVQWSRSRRMAAPWKQEILGMSWLVCVGFRGRILLGALALNSCCLISRTARSPHLIEWFKCTKLMRAPD